MKDGRGVIEVGYIFVTLPTDNDLFKVLFGEARHWYALKLGLMTNEQIPMVPTLMMSDNGVKTCNLEDRDKSKLKVVSRMSYLVSCSASRTTGSRVSTGRPFMIEMSSSLVSLSLAKHCCRKCVRLFRRKVREDGKSKFRTLIKNQNFMTS